MMDGAARHGGSGFTGGTPPEEVQRAMRVCQGCDTPLDFDDRFCSQCGSDAATGAVATEQEPAGPATGLRSLESVLRQDRSDAGRLTLAAFDRLCDGEVDDALLAAESAVAMNPRLWSAHLIAGVARNQRGETEHAEAHLQDALQAESMALHHKATLERMLAAVTPRKPTAVLSALRTPRLSPAAWSAIAAATALLIGLIWIALTGPVRRGQTTREVAYSSAGSTAAPLQPAVQPFPTPIPAPATPLAPAPGYSPPSYNPAPPVAYSRQSPSAAPPINTQDTPYPLSRPGDGDRSSRGGTDGMTPLPPARADLSGSPELQNPARYRVEPINRAPNDIDRQTARQPGVSVAARPSPGSARVGFEPGTLNRSNLAAPSDAVVSSSQVRVAPRPAAAKTDTSDTSSGEPARRSGRSIQAEARRLEAQGRPDAAAQAYREAIDAYQDDIARGVNPRAAEYGIAASRAALDLLESH